MGVKILFCDGDIEMPSYLEESKEMDLELYHIITDIAILNDCSVLSERKIGNNINNDMRLRYNLYHVVLARKKGSDIDGSYYEIIANVWIVHTFNSDFSCIPCVYN